MTSFISDDADHTFFSHNNGKASRLPSAALIDYVHEPFGVNERLALGLTSSSSRITRQQELANNLQRLESSFKGGDISLTSSSFPQWDDKMTRELQELERAANGIQPMSGK
jgi:hypothetical protein